MSSIVEIFKLKLNWRCKVLVSLALAVLSWVTTFSFCQAKPAVAWQLDQHSDILGECQVYAFHDGVKVVCKKLKCEVLATAPDWKVHCYRTDERVEWIDDLANFGGDNMCNPFARLRKLRSVKLIEQGTGNLNGLNYTKYTTKVSPRDLLYVANDISVAPQVSEFLARLYVTPVSGRIPVYRCEDRSRKQKLEEEKIGTIEVGKNADLRTGLVDKLKTKKWKKIPLKTVVFKMPSGYRRTKELYQATYSSSKKGEFSEIFDEIGYKSDSRALRNRANTK